MAAWSCFCLFFLIDGMIFYQYCSVLFQSRYARWINLFSMFVLYGILAFIFIFNQSILNLVFFFCFNFIYLCALYFTKWYEALFHTALSTVVMVLGKMMVIFLSPHVPNYSFSSWDSFRIWMIPGLFDKSVYFTVMIWFAHFAEKIKHKETVFNRGSLYAAATPVVSIFITYTFLILRKECILPPFIYSLIVMSALLLLALNVITLEIYNYNQKRESEFIEIQLLHQKDSALLDYYKALILQNENQMQLIHDIKKHLQSIAILNQRGEQEKTTTYINNILQSPPLKASAYLCNHEFLNAILSRYVSVCEQFHISFRVDIRNKSVDFIKEDDITSIFCNILDNAVKAASRVPDSIIDLTSYCQEQSSFTIITLANSCQKNPFKQEIGQPASAKSNQSGHGYGLRIVKQIVKNYDGEIQHYFSDEDNLFHTIITLKSPAL